MTPELLQRVSTSLSAFCSDHGWSQADMDVLDSVNALIAELAQPQAEPEYWQWRCKSDPWSANRIFHNEVFATTDDSEVRALYATPQQAQIKSVTQEIRGTQFDAAPAVPDERGNARVDAIAADRDYWRERFLALESAAPAVQPLKDWEFVAMWATAHEKHDDTYDTAVEFGRAVETRHGIAAPGSKP